MSTELEDVNSDIDRLEYMLECDIEYYFAVYDFNKDEFISYYDDGPGGIKYFRYFDSMHFIRKMLSKDKPVAVYLVLRFYHFATEQTDWHVNTIKHVWSSMDGGCFDDLEKNIELITTEVGRDTLIEQRQQMKEKLALLRELKAKLLENQTLRDVLDGLNV